MTPAQKRQLIRMHDNTVDRLAHHKAMMAEHGAWLDEAPGRRAEAEEIALELERFAANARDDLGMHATDANGHVVTPEGSRR